MEIDNSAKGDAREKRHYFRLKGHSTEAIIQQFANKSFLTEWCFPNPIDEEGNEICDLLVLFEGTLLIIQIKDIAFKGSEERYVRKAFDSPIKQVYGAERRLLKYGTPVSVTNAYGVTEIINATDIKTVHRIVFSVGDGEVTYSAIREERGKIIHIFDRSIETVLNELDTISDFCKYLSDKEDLYSGIDSTEIIAFGELDLLAMYLMDGRSFDDHKEFDSVLVAEGMWDHFTSHQQYKNKVEADSISYLWDHIIEFSHTCPGEDYRIIAKEMSRLNRFERRCASEAFLSAHERAVKSGNDFRRTFETNGVTYVFVFTPLGRERKQRFNQLNNVCIVARHVRSQNPKVIGIATEIGISIPHSYDFVYLDFPEWDEENQKLAEKIQKEYGVYKNLIETPFSLTEYPLGNGEK